MTPDPNDDDAPIRTVGELRRLLGNIEDHTPVQVHLGWDLPIVTWIVDQDGLTLFANDDDVVAVSRDWYDKNVEATR